MYERDVCGMPDKEKNEYGNGISQNADVIDGGCVYTSGLYSVAGDDCWSSHGGGILFYFNEYRSGI